MLIPFFFLLSLSGFSQVPGQQRLAFRIDSLAALGLPKSALAEVDKLDRLARKNKDTPAQIKATFYRLTFLAYLEENALVSVINQLKKDIAAAAGPVKPVLQSVLAEVYLRYYQQHRYQFSQRSQLRTPSPDFTQWDLRTILQEVAHLHQAALKDTAGLQKTPLGVLGDALVGDAATRPLRPTLYDLLAQRALAFYLHEEADLPKPRYAFSLNNLAYFGDSHAFSQLTLPKQDTSANLYRGLVLLQQASRFHIARGNAEALADLELQRLQVLHQKSTLPARDSLYRSRLHQIAQVFRDKPISTDALFLSAAYYQRQDSLLQALPYLDEAIERFPESLGGRNAARAREEILLRQLSVQVEHIVPARHPVLALANFKNLQQAQATLYKLTEAQLSQFHVLTSRIRNNNRTGQSVKASQQVLAFLDKQKAIPVLDLVLPDPGDHRNHRVEFKMDGLNPGDYVLLVQGGTRADTTLMQVGTFKVTNLAYTSRINPDGALEVRVMNRKEGKPLPRVRVLVQAKVWANNRQQNRKIGEGLSDKTGRVLFFKPEQKGFVRPEQHGQLAFTLVAAGDTLTDPDNYVSGALLRHEENQDEEKTILFTDRQVYRPGQTIYFKGLQVKKVRAKSELVTGESLEVDFSDVNQKTISTLQVKTNEFGSFSGSFQIPVALLTGEVSLSTPDGAIQVRVEAYKRPSFQINFETVKGSYQLNDSVGVKGQVMAFAGYGLTAAGIQYRVMRQAILIPYGNHLTPKRGYPREEMAIQSGTIQADAAGHFEIRFKALAEIRPDDPAQQYTYTVTAAITDAAGETQEATTAVQVGQRALSLQLHLPRQVLLPDTLKAQVQLTNLNSQLQAGSVTLDIFSLQQPDKPYKNRLWEHPDVSAWKAGAFEKEFPDYAPLGREEYRHWPLDERILSQTLSTTATQATPLRLAFSAGQKAGVYLVLARGLSEKGDTISVKDFFTLVSEKDNKPALMEDWIVPVKQNGKPGETALFLVGAGKSQVLVEVYNGPGLVSSEWVETGTKQSRVEIPIKAGYGSQVRVQFMMIADNRAYTASHPIRVLGDAPHLDIRFTTFRDKLLPGEKETWKLQVSGMKNPGQAAEMVASLYDAALNKIAEPHSWTAPFEQLVNAYSPHYYAWQTWNFVNASSTRPLKYPAPQQAAGQRDYEQLNFFGYSYFGGYNHAYREYLNRVERQKKAAATNQYLEREYKRNAALIKNGVEVSGRVIGKRDKQPLPGVAIRIKGTQIGTMSNSEGYFRIKVPARGRLVFSFVGYNTRETVITKAGNIVIALEEDGKALQEVVVSGYGVARKASLTGAVSSRIQQAPAANEVMEMADVAVTEQANAAGAAYPSAPRRPETPQIAIRRNLQETAFFYPLLRTNEHGEITVAFTVPEALTTWQFKGLAHTRELQWGYLEGQVVTRKMVMVSPYLPRFFREGDTLTVSARVANLSGEKLSGKVKLEFFNALNNQPLRLLLHEAAAEQDFSLAAGATGPVSFTLAIPAHIGAVTYRITAQTRNYSDGEENTLPVLPNALLVTESLPLLVRPGQAKTFSLDKLVHAGSSSLKSQTLTFEYTHNPVWTAVQALPYLMEYPYECAEQVFSRFYANSLAAAIVQQSPVISQVFARWRAADSQELLSNLEKNQELKQTLLTETPWLREAASETEQKKRIALLFDLNNIRHELAQNLDKLAEMQLSDGSFPWFAGMPADRFISRHILAGLGQLQHLGLLPPANGKLLKIKTQALASLDRAILRDEAQRLKVKAPRLPEQLSTDQIHAWYTRSYFADTPLSPQLQKAWQRYQQQAASGWQYRSTYEKGLIALAMHRYKLPDLPKRIIRSLLETARQSEEMGMYWPQNQAGCFWYQSPVETQVLLLELFTETAAAPSQLAEMKLWLLRHKQTNNWGSTKATAAACYALLLRGGDGLATPAPATITLGGQPLQALKPDLAAAAGTGYMKTSWAQQAISPALGQVAIKNNGQVVSWGALHWQYLEKTDKITASHTQLKLRRQYFIQQTTDGQDLLVPVDARRQPQVGDLLKVVIYLESDRELEYLQLKDLRPAGTEPVAALSGYRYQDGLHYYQATGDAATNFFISRLGKGRYVFEYHLRVAQAGDFATGISTIQSMYAPEFNAHSEGGRIQFNK